MRQKEIFEQAYADFADSIFRYVYFRIFDRDGARDLTQETFYRTWDYLAKDREIDNIKAFLFRTAHNLAVNAIRNRKQTSSLETMREETGFDAPDAQSAQTERDLTDVRDVIDSFSTLKAEDAEIMTMRYVDGLSVREISEITELSENNISVKIHRLIEKLKEYHNQHGT